MKETIEIRNETNRPIRASACRSKLSGMLYVHVGEAHKNEVEIPAQDYAVVEVEEVKL